MSPDDERMRAFADAGVGVLDAALARCAVSNPDLLDGVRRAVDDGHAHLELALELGPNAVVSVRLVGVDEAGELRRVEIFRCGSAVAAAGLQ